MGLGGIKTVVTWLVRLKRARDYFNKEGKMPGLINTLKHVGYVALGLLATSIVTFLSNDGSVAEVLTKGGLPAVYVAIALPLFHLAATAIENFVKHISEPPA